MVLLRSKKLKNDTGIFGHKDKFFQQGFLWSRVKIRAMKKGASNDYIIVSRILFQIYRFRLT